jgi:hypothetical protein
MNARVVRVPFADVSAAAMWCAQPVLGQAPATLTPQDYIAIQQLVAKYADARRHARPQGRAVGRHRRRGNETLRLVPWKRDDSPNSRAGHPSSTPPRTLRAAGAPGWLRCSSLTYAQ